ncbi:MAG: hypothetical protein N2235_11540 [Fischerella sp.]|nr:hypothetical protein [Fischerella sp.]
MWAGLSLLLFILYHLLNSKIFFRCTDAPWQVSTKLPGFFDLVFLTLTGLLGLGCSVAYALIGSLWAIATIHWIVVTIWLLFLEGMYKLHQQNENSGVANYIGMK